MRAEGRKIWEEAPLIGGPVASHFARMLRLRVRLHSCRCVKTRNILLLTRSRSFRHNEITNISHFSFLHLHDYYKVNNTSLDQLSSSSEAKLEEGGNSRYDSKSRNIYKMYDVYRAGLEKEARNITPRSVIESFDYIDRWMIQKQTNPNLEERRKISTRSLESLLLLYFFIFGFLLLSFRLPFFFLLLSSLEAEFVEFNFSSTLRRTRFQRVINEVKFIEQRR